MDVDLVARSFEQPIAVLFQKFITGEQREIMISQKWDCSKEQPNTMQFKSQCRFLSADRL